MKEGSPEKIDGIEIYAKNIKNDGKIISDTYAKIVTEQYEGSGEIERKAEQKKHKVSPWVLVLVIVVLMIFFGWKFTPEISIPFIGKISPGDGKEKYVSHNVGFSFHDKQGNLMVGVLGTHLDYSGMIYLYGTFDNPSDQSVHIKEKYLKIEFGSSTLENRVMNENIFLQSKATGISIGLLNVNNPKKILLPTLISDPHVKLVISEVFEVVEDDWYRKNYQFKTVVICENRLENVVNSEGRVPQMFVPVCYRDY